MTVAVVGLGSVGRRHARNLLALGDHHMVLVRTGLGQAGPLEAPLDELPVVTTLPDAVRAGATAVVVANPTSLHAQTMWDAVRAGCHVLVEKPVAHDLEGLEQVHSEAAQAGLAVLVGYQFRFHPTLRALRTAIREGAIGRVIAAHAHWGEYLPDWHPDEDYRAGYSARADLGGGVVRTLSHPIDYLRWIVGEVTTASGYARPAAGLDADVDGVAVAALHFDDGALGTLSLDYAERPTRHTLHVTGAAGRAEWDGLSGTALLWYAGRAEPEVMELPAGFQRNDLFVEEMRHFLACCEGTETPACTLADGVRALEIGLQILSSSASD